MFAKTATLSVLVAASGATPRAVAEPARPADDPPAATIEPIAPVPTLAPHVARDVAADGDPLDALARDVRPITRDRVEALVSAGTSAARHAAARASGRRGPLGVELAGELRAFDRASRDGAGERSGARGVFTAAWTRGPADLRLFGELAQLADAGSSGRITVGTSGRGARLALRPRRLLAGLEHQLGFGAGVVQATSGSSEPPDSSHQSMSPRVLRGAHRILAAYLEDTVRVIPSLDLTSGIVLEHWSHLGRREPAPYREDAMNADVPEVAELCVGPELAVRYRASDRLVVRARGSRRLRPPTASELYRPGALPTGPVAPDPGLRPETITAIELGPELATGPLAAHAALHATSIDAPISIRTTPDGAVRANLPRARTAGLHAGLRLRAGRGWIAEVTYAFTASRVATGAGDEARLPRVPRHRAAATLAFDDPRVVTVSVAFRYSDRSYADDRNTQWVPAHVLFEATVVRRIAGGVAAYVAIENALDRRHVSREDGVDEAGAPRTVRVGVRLDTARF